MHAYPTMNVFFTDADALWLKDPQTLLYRPPPPSSSSSPSMIAHITATADYDIIASRGVFPQNCSLGIINPPARGRGRGRSPSATSCFGLTYFRNSPVVRKLTTDLEMAMGVDDQLTLNCLLRFQYQRIVNTTTDESSSIAPAAPDDDTIFRTYLMSNATQQNDKSDDVNGKLTLKLLSYQQIPRKCRNEAIIKNATVAHCYTVKNGNSKIEAFRHWGFVQPEVASSSSSVNVTFYDWST